MAAGMGGQRSAARDEAQGKLLGLLGQNSEIILRNYNGGDDARLSKSSIKKMTSPPSIQASARNGFTLEQYCGAASDIVDLYKNAFKLADSSDRNGHPDVRIQRYGAPFGVDDGVAYITVKESTVYGKKVHDIQLVKIGKLRGISTAERVTSLHKPSTPSFLIDNIRKLESKVNTQDEKV